MKPAAILWNEKANCMAVCDVKSLGGLPLMTIVDEDFEGINPFFCYPLEYLLKWYGWIKIGEL